MLSAINKLQIYCTQKKEFSMKHFFSKFDHIRRFLQIWSHILKKSLMENFIFCVVIARKKARKCKDIFLVNKYLIYQKVQRSYSIVASYFPARYYLSLMNFMQNLIFITSYYIYSKLLTILIFNLMMLVESGIFLEIDFSCNLC